MYHPTSGSGAASASGAALSRSALALTLLVGLMSGPSVSAESPNPPPFYAIRDAQVVTGTGQTLEGATVLIADGLIEDVGADVKVPSDAWVIDGEGLMLFPGLIDALTDLGLKRNDSSSPGRGGRPGTGPPPPTIRGPEDRPQTKPWRSAADMLGDEDHRIGQWREAGFTAAVTGPGDGFFPGQAAIIHLGDAEARERVLETQVAQRLAFRGSGGFRTFPGSLMGGIAYVRQVLSDADHYGRANELYRASPSGKKRPAYDRTLAPLHTAVEANLPFLMPAIHAREIDRALNMAKDWGLRPVILGGHGAYDRIERLEAASASVLLNLDWPEADKDADPEAKTPLPEIYHRRKAPASPRALHDAGIPFAFTSGDLPSPAKIFEGVRAAIDAGLSEAAALEALTLGAARIYGVDDRLGSIEAGKIANLVLATAAPWSEDVEIRTVFVDGRRYQQRQDDDADKEPPASDVSGTWALELQTPGGLAEMTADLKMSEDGKVTGEVSGERGTRTVEKGRMSGDELTFKTTRTMGSRTIEASYSLEVVEDTMAGNLNTSQGSLELTGQRSAEAGSGSGDEDEEPAVSLDELEAAMALYHGPVRDLDAFAITHAKVYTVAGDVLEDATVVVEGGKITAVGHDVRIPRGAETIDASGGSLIPGIIDAHSHIAGEGGLNEGTIAVSSMVTVGDIVEPGDIAVYRAVAGGVTTINMLHGSANPIGGGNVVLKLRWGSDADGMVFQGAPPGIKFALGENPKRSRGNPPPGVPRRYPATRMGVMDVIDQAFTEARSYQKSWQDYERNGKQGMPPRRDFKLEPLAEILDGKRLVHAHCYRADEILQLMRLAEDHSFRVGTLQHVLEGYKVADEIAAHGAGASTFSDWWGFKVEAYDAIPHNAALMTERGVVVSINSDSGEEMRHLNQEAAKAMKWGDLDHSEALKLVTLNPAIQLGIEDRVGSIEVGKDADLVLYDGDPLSIFSVVQKTFIDGDLYFDLQADRERQAAIQAVLEKLKTEDEEDDEGDDDSDASPPPERSRQNEEWHEMTYTCREVH